MANTYISKATSGTPTNNKKWTYSCWVKRNKLGEGSNSDRIYIHERGSGHAHTHKIEFGFSNDNKFFFGTWDGSAEYHSKTDRQFTDINCWYHIVVACDSTQSTNTDRLKFYFNGEQYLGGYSSGPSYPAQDWVFNSNTWTHHLGVYVSSSGAGNYLNGCISDFCFVDGQQLTPTSFGETDTDTGEWRMKDFSASDITWGTNGYRILKDGSSLTDVSSNSHNFTLGGGTLTNTEDCPSNVFATNNYNWKQESSRFLSHTCGNTMISGQGSSTWYQTPATLAFNKGKFYWECKFNASTNLDKNTVGVIDYQKTQEDGQFQDATGSVFYKNEDGGETRLDATTSSADYGTLAQNDILGVAVDMDATTPTVKFYKNGSLLVTVNASSLAGKFVTPAQSVYTSGEYQVNYGNGYFGTTAISSEGTNASGIGKFELDVPSGYTALSTKGINT